MSIRLLVFGGSGAVGHQVIAQSLDNPNIGQVIAPTRSALPIKHEKLVNPLIQFEQLANIDWWQADMVICALGTTRKQAGSAKAFVEVDFHYVTTIALRSKRAGINRFVLNSSVGAQKPRGLYLKTKYHAEKELMAMGFDQLTIVRPSLIDVDTRPDFRLGETLALAMSRPFSQLIPAQYRPISPAKIAQAMLAASNQEKALQVIENSQLHLR